MSFPEGLEDSPFNALFLEISTLQWVEISNLQWVEISRINTLQFQNKQTQKQMKQT